MNREQKELLVKTLKDDFKNSDGSFLILFKGIPVSKLQQLRKGIKTEGNKLKIAKARLVKIAVKDVPYVKDLTPFLKDQLGVVFSKHDPIATIKSLYKFSKENEKLKIVAGCFDHQIYENKSIEQIAKLPSKEMLFAQLCYVLQAPITKLAQLVDALKEKNQKVN